ncbi:MAG: hypothetical protein CBC47_02555 [Alphaproteobacteria bacterium TMED87]|nr:quinone oxidoreductase [Rhodospirillaceae bacterium]OUV10838.1 MAG: hypothetical protein CBC47_02555 [Alphaproteobacteria bacterium TMED87]
MSKKVIIKARGAPDVMQISEESISKPGEGLVKIKHELIGVNFIDTYHRSGLYPINTEYFTPGMEAIGYVTEIGSGVEDFKEGDRVCYGNGPIGSYCSERIMPHSTLFKVPKYIKNEDLAGSVLRFLTVWYLVEKLYCLSSKDIVLFHAAAGGVGLVFCQWAKSLGATVIGTVSSEKKAKLALDHGCSFIINYRQNNFLDEVMKITNGEGVSVVYDGVGKSTFHDSLKCLKRKGLMVSFGNASGPAPDLDVSSLGPLGSLFVTRPTLLDYTNDRNSLKEAFSRIFSLIRDKDIVSDVVQSYPLEDCVQSHTDLENRLTHGSTVLTVP